MLRSSKRKNTMEEDRHTLSIDDGRDNSVEESTTPFDERILKLVEANPKKVYPARLVSELGISADEASAELCGLMAAIGSGASFSFEKLGGDGPPTMVFTFPPDFARRARRSRRQQDLRAALGVFLEGLIKFLKILTAFGLILSLLIVSVAAILGLFAAIVALSRGGDDRHRSVLLSRVRTLFYSMRQLLWCYAMFGQNLEGQDPFLQEIAYDLALLCHPGSLWFWLNAHRLQRRRTWMQRGWGSSYQHSSSTDETASLVRRGVWGQGDDSGTRMGRSQPDEYRGLLSVAVEFLFGHSPFEPGPTNTEKSRLRAAVILEKSNRGQNVSLRELSPYVDDPMESGSASTGLVAECLAIVVHFHGIPADQSETSKEAKSLDSRFVFPELVAESSYITNYEESPNFDDGSFQSLLYVPDVSVVSSARGQVPSFMEERRFRLTNLESSRFVQCAVLGLLNLIGVLWLRQSLMADGVLANFLVDSTVIGILAGLVKVLVFYALLFWALPLGRLAIVLLYNSQRQARNKARADLALGLQREGKSQKKDSKSGV